MQTFRKPRFQYNYSRMIRASLLALFSTLIICGFCGKEFVSLGRYTWRCKNKVEFDQTSKQNNVPAVEIRA